jgi:hypothetical protein
MIRTISMRSEKKRRDEGRKTYSRDSGFASVHRIASTTRRRGARVGSDSDGRKSVIDRSVVNVQVAHVRNGVIDVRSRASGGSGSRRNLFSLSSVGNGVVENVSVVRAREDRDVASVKTVDKEVGSEEANNEIVVTPLSVDGDRVRGSPEIDEKMESVHSSHHEERIGVDSVRSDGVDGRDLLVRNGLEEVFDVFGDDSLSPEQEWSACVEQERWRQGVAYQ